MSGFEALAANPSSKLVVVPMESAALAGGIVQALQLLNPAQDRPAATRPAAPPPAAPLPGGGPWTPG